MGEIGVTGQRDAQPQAETDADEQTFNAEKHKIELSTHQGDSDKKKQLMELGMAHKAKQFDRAQAIVNSGSYSFEVPIRELLQQV